MLNDELPSSRKKIGKRQLALRPLEGVRLVDPLPGQCAPLLCEFLALTSESLLLGQQRLARGQPFVV